MATLKNNELGYLGNPNVKRDGVQEAWSQEQITEYTRCLRDPVYFAKTHLKVIHLDHGLVDFDLYPYQEKMFSHFDLHDRFPLLH